MNESEIQKLGQALPDGDLIRSVGSAARLLTGDGAIPIDVDGSYIITKGSAAALTVAAPGTGNVGRRIRITSGTDFAHVITFTGGTLWDGTAGANSTSTATAVQGCSLEVMAVSATKWNVLNFNQMTIAP